jgi:hypothetical protein
MPDNNGGEGPRKPHRTGPIGQYAGHPSNPNDDPRKPQEAARAAEDAGFDDVVALENAYGPIPALIAAALSTESV